MAKDMLSVTYFYREPRDTGVSMEGIFRQVRKDLEGKVDIKEFYCDKSLSRFQNTKLAKKHAGEINHITGDVNFLAVGLKGAKTILTIHDIGYYENPGRTALKKAVYGFFWFKLPLKYVDIVTVVSKFTKERLMHHFRFPEERIRVIHDPVKPLFQYAPKPQIGTPPVVLMMGTGKHKNLDGLIEAAKDTNFHLDIIGWPASDEVAKLESYGISYKVYNKLTDEEVYERYKACDVLFNASLYEGFGMPIIEAQSVGRPVVASNRGAMKEVVGDAGLLVDPAKPNEIREAISKLVGNKAYYDKLVNVGRGNIAEYQHEKIADQYLQVYKEISELKK